MDTNLIALCFALITLATKLLEFVKQQWEAAHTKITTALTGTAKA